MTMMDRNIKGMVAVKYVFTIALKKEEKKKTRKYYILYIYIYRYIYIDSCS